MSVMQPALASSSSTLWAIASKEWVIPAKPKSGRKRKTGAAPPVREAEDGQIDSAGRRVQNRAAQRAFRERKQTQLAELQARIRLYEQGEIERNVALQNIAKKLKDENEQLRKENYILRTRVASCEKEHATNGRWEVDGKRRRDDSSATYSVSSDHPTKRTKIAKQTAAFVVSEYASPPSIAPSPNSGNIFPSASFDSPSREEPNFPPPPSPLVDTADLQCILKPIHDKGDADCAFSAVVCGRNTDCFCREMALDEPAADGTLLMQTSLNLANFEHKVHTEQSVDSTKPSTQIESILENLPAYQAPIPLRRRAIAATFHSVFPVSEPIQYHSSASPSATCSGDPANCMACADDSFGQAFCAAIGESVTATPPCDGCPCCPDTPGGNRNRCIDAVERAPHERGVSSAAGTSNTIPTNDAWRQLKSHPNVAFADLSLLADVVARRSKCTGPRVVISPAPGAATPERVNSPSVDPEQGSSDNRSIFLTDPHALYHDSKTNAPSPRFVSRELLVECGRQSVRKVRADAVKEALHMLDSQFSQL